jgi:hypothetical protein
MEVDWHATWQLQPSNFFLPKSFHYHINKMSIKNITNVFFIINLFEP